MTKKEQYINELYKKELVKISFNTQLPISRLTDIFNLYQQDYFEKALGEWSGIPAAADSLGLEQWVADDLNFLLYQTNDEQLLELRDNTANGQALFRKVCDRLADKYFENDNDKQIGFLNQMVMNNSFENLLLINHGISADTSIKGRVNIQTRHTYDNELIDAVRQLDFETLVKAKEQPNTAKSIDYLYNSSVKGKHLAGLIVKREIDNSFKKIQSTHTEQIFMKSYDGVSLANAFNVEKVYDKKITNAKTQKNATEMVGLVCDRFKVDLTDRVFRVEHNLISMSEKLELAQQRMNRLANDKQDFKSVKTNKGLKR